MNLWLTQILKYQQHRGSRKISFFDHEISFETSIIDFNKLSTT